jgi:hypothetical protein
MNNTIIYGIDLSFNSTGICVYNLINNIGKKIDFYKIIYNKNDSSSLYNQKIPNVKSLYYHLPVNFNINNVSSKEVSDINQTEATVKGLMIKRVIDSIFKSKYNDDITNIIVCIENYIMPAFSGKNQLNTVGGLIMLQGFIRELFIEHYLEHNNFELKFCFPTPSHNKYSFGYNGNATKEEMISTFITYYNGNSLLPDLTKYKIDDLIDAFSLAIYGYKNGLYSPEDFMTDDEIKKMNLKHENKKKLLEKKKMKRSKMKQNIEVLNERENKNNKNKNNNTIYNEVLQALTLV